MKIANTMKRALCLVLVLIIMSMSTAFAVSGVFYVNTKKLNVRTGPSSDYSVKKELRKGDVVSYQKSKNGWYFVKYAGGSGWVYRGYLTKVNTSKTSTVKYRATCTLNIRDKASNNAFIVGTVKKGAKNLTIKKTSHGYAYITYNGTSGWVVAKYLKKM